MKTFNENWDGRLPRKNNTNGINTLSEASQQVIGKYRFTPFTKDTNSEGTAGWTISIQGKGVVAYIAEPKMDSTGSPSLQRARAATSPYKIFRTKGLSFKNFFPGELKMSAYPGTENRINSEKEIRFAPRQLIQAVAMWMDKYGTKALTEASEVVAEILTPLQSDAVRRGAKNAEYLDKAIADFAKDMKALAAKGDPRKDLKAFKAYIPVIHNIEDGMDRGGGLTWPYDTATGKTKASFLKGLSPEQQKAEKALRSISIWWTQSGLQRITPTSEKIWNNGWNSYRKYMGERVTEEVAEAKAPFPKPFKKGETLFAPNKSGKMLKGELVSYETGKAAGGSFTLKLTGQNESGTIVVGAEALFKANPSKMLKKESNESAEETENAAGAQSLDEVQFITPKVPLTGGSNSNSKEKTDYKLYVELKDTVMLAIMKLEQAELMLRSPSKNSTLNILQTVIQAKQRLKKAV